MNPIASSLFSKLSKIQILTITLIGVTWLIAITIYEVNSQFNQERNIIEQKSRAIAQQMQLEQKRTETLLNGLSEFYTSQTVKSLPAFREFAKGLLTNNNQTIGLAELVSRTRQKEVEIQQQNIGYESFKISNSGLFTEQTGNDLYAFLAVTSIIPLDPQRSVYLSEDLFSIPQMVTKFTHSIEHNEPQTLLLTKVQNNELYKITFKPIYLNTPHLLNHAQRLKQTRGIVFILQPVLKEIEAQINHFFNSKNTIITLNKTDAANDSQTSKIHILQDNLKAKSFLDEWINLKTTTQFPALPNMQEPKIEFVRPWHISNINLTKLAKSLLLGLISYALLTFFILWLIRYTQSLRQTKTRLSQLLLTSQDAVIITNDLGYIIDWNPEAENIFGFLKEEAIGEHLVSLIFDNSSQNLDGSEVHSERTLSKIFRDSLKLNQAEGKANRTEINLLNRSRNPITSELTIALMNVKNHTEISLFIKDITYQRQTEEAITKMAYFDALTQLENRVYFKQSVENHIKKSPNEKMALLFMDLDGFKQVNDTLGHSVGDELLKVVGKRIQSALRSHEDTNHICRFGGDEFVIMFSQIDENNASQISLRLLNQIERIIKIDNDELQISASIGIAFYPEHGEDVDTLLRHADTAMYRSKEQGKNTYSIYHQSMEADLAERILIEKHLRTAIQNKEFFLLFQPQINLQSGKVVGVEALIRWNNPVLGFVPPDKFIPIAEESNLILRIGEWVAQECIKQLSEWKGTRFDSLHIAMNVSSVQFENPHFLSFVSKLMQNANIHNHLLEIELTERTVMNNVTENIARFNKIRANGFGLSVDDFGTGYSSLSYLKKFPLSVLKIDKSFVDGIPQEEEDISIATAILNLAHSLKMRVVAEGIETREQLEYLKELNCDFAQGYYISHPLAISELESWFHTNDCYFHAFPLKEELHVQ